MSCEPGIYSRLPMTSPPEGAWTYIGFNATSDTGPWTGTPAVPLVNVAPGTSLASWGYNFTLVNDGKTPGYYRFQYDYVGGSDDVTIYIQSDSICPGQDYGITIEEGTALTFNLFSLISGGSCPSPQIGGAWINQDSAPGFDPFTSELDTTTITEGQYVFEYLIAEPEGLECSDCRTSAFVTLTIASPAALDATIAKTDVNCNYTLTVHNSVTNVVNNMYFSVPVDAYGPTVMYRAKVTNCDAKVIYDNVVTVPNAVRIHTRVNTTPMQNGGYMSTIRLRTTTGVNIIVPLEPGTAIYTGPGGTTNATELTFNTSSSGVFFSAIRKATINYLHTLGYTQGIHYDMLMPVFSSGTNVEIRFACKHNPSGFWLGYSLTSGQILYYEAPFAIRSTLMGTVGGYGVSLTESFSSLPCVAGSNALVRNMSIAFVDFIYTCDFNYISIVASDIAATVTGTNTRSCTDKALTANATGCSGSVSYLWGTGQTTQTIKVPYIAGITHTVDVSCTSPSSSVTKTITL